MAETMTYEAAAERFFKPGTVLSRREIVIVEQVGSEKNGWTWKTRRGEDKPDYVVGGDRG